MRLREYMFRRRALVTGAATTAVTVAASIPAFASGSGSDSLSSVAVTSDMLSPLLDGITANIGVILPIGIAIFAVFIGINLVPKLIKKFTH